MAHTAVAVTSPPKAAATYLLVRLPCKPFKPGCRTEQSILSPLVSLRKRFRESGTGFRTFDFMALSRGVGIFDRLTRGLSQWGARQVGSMAGSEGDLGLRTRTATQTSERRRYQINT